MKLAQLIDQAQQDKSVRVIFIHGGKNYSTGTNLKGFMTDINSSPDEYYKRTTFINLHALLMVTMAIKNSNKPIVGFVRGWCVGIAYTLSPLFTFLYCTPDSKFLAPFSTSFQIPEGSSSISFPALVGQRKANEILFTSEVLNAEEAKRFSIVNEILPELG